MRNHGPAARRHSILSAKEPLDTSPQAHAEDASRNLSPHTQSTYVLQVSQFARHFGKSPHLLGPEHIRTYQVFLTTEKKLAPGSIGVAVAALRFLYRVPSSPGKSSSSPTAWRASTTAPS